MASITIHMPWSSSSLFFFFLLFLFFYLFSRVVKKNNPQITSTTTHTPSSSTSSSSSSSAAAAAAAAISNSNSSYDVFLSFRGEDTRYTFTDHLYRALIRNGINTFRDDEGLDRGAEIAPELLKAIEGSKLSIVVFSENYAHSKWCLEELAKIMECNKERNQTVIPIFYRVDPSEQVRKQRGSYGKAFALHQKGADEEKRKKIQKWRSALSEAANLAGHHIIQHEYESEPIEKIIDFILKNLNSKFMLLEEFIVGMDSRKKELKSLLNTYAMLGIYGAGGMGKTTTAKIIYNDIISEFDGGSFLQNVREEFEKGHQLQLQQQLLCDTMKRDITLRTTNDGISLIKDRLNSKKVLIVVDDVDNSNQLESLMGSLRWFHSESRVIITTRNRQVLSNYGANASSYEIKGLNYNDAFQLFCWHAFEQHDPKENYENLSKCIVGYAGGLPLAIKVLGSFFHDKMIDEWKSEFDKLKKNPKEDINNVLKISFEGLDNIDKKVFLDIACFFKGEDRDFVSEILDNCGLFGKVGIKNLLNKCLITISDKNTIDMHDLVQQMGWAIVREETSNPYKWTRLWDPDDIHNAFFEKEGIKNIEAISCDLSRIKDIKMNKKVLTKMKKLRLLKVYWSGGCGTLILPKDFEFSSQALRYFYWEAYPLKTLPSNFEGENLVELHLPRSNIKQLWSGSKILGKVKAVNLRHSKKLVKMPKFSTIPNLERLNLEGCSSLRELDSSIGDLKKLTFLDLGWCTKLRDLPSNIDGLQSLEFLSINNCRKLKKFPEIRGTMRRLGELHLRGSGIKELPNNIQYLPSLKVLLLSPYPSLHNFLPSGTGIEHRASSRFYVKAIEDQERMTRTNLLIGRLQGSSRGGIKEIPSCIESLTSLEVLSLFRCQNFEKFPEIHGNIGCLKVLDLRSSGIKEFPSSFKYLTSLEYLNLSNCSNFERFPEIFGNMRLLRKLILDKSGIIELPRSIGGLESLEILSLSDCSNFEIFPEIQGNMKSLRQLYLQHTAIKQLPSSIDCLESLETLSLRGCRSFEIFPKIQRNMKSLRQLWLQDTAIKELPGGLGCLESLEQIDLRGCVNLEKFPEIQRDIRNLRELSLHETAIKELPSSIENLRGLQHLQFWRCENLVTLPDSIGGLTCLKTLMVWDCSNLQKLPDNLRSLQCCLETLIVSGCKLEEGAIPSDLWSLYSLTYLNIGGNDIRSIPAGIVQLSKLGQLDMNDCKLLEEITELPSSLIVMAARGCPGPCLETLLSNHSSKLSSLYSLDIRQSGIRSIPAAIIQLSTLEHLFLNDCKLLEEITELPLSLKRMQACGCPCLETSVSNPSSKLWSSLIKCFKSCTQEVKCYSKRKYSWEEPIQIFLPGNNGIPEWVRHKNIGGEVTIDLPPNWYNDNNLLGFAFFFNFNGPLVDPQNTSLGFSSFKLTISEADQFEEVYSFNVGWSTSDPELLVRYVPQMAIAGNPRSNNWRRLKAYLSFFDQNWKSYEETFPGTCKSTICGIHLIYAEVHQRQNEKHFLEWLGENENTGRNAKRRLREAENQREQEPPHHKRSRPF